MLNRLFICSVITLCLLTGCVRAAASTDKNPADPAQAAPKEGEYRKISAQEAHKMMSGTNDYVLLDVRTAAEYKEQQIDGALLIPDNEIKNRATAELPDKNKVILIYCRSGRRSESAARELVNLGYVNVFDFGGIINWPYDTVRD